MAEIDKNYHKLLETILKDGFKYEDPNRKGVNRIQIPSYQFKHDFKDGFPAITTKKLYWKGVVGELLWILNGSTNIKYLVDNDINIWNKDAYNYYLKKCKEVYKSDFKPMSFETFIKQIKNGSKGTQNSGYTLGYIGRGYGAQWRNWFGSNNNHEEVIIDQISNLIKGLKENPMGTRHIVSAWNPAELDDMALPPCHWSFEILVEPLNLKTRKELYNNKGNFISTGSWGMSEEDIIKEYNKEYDRNNIPKYQFTLKWHQRSVDTFLGLPFNISSYALLAQIIGKMTNMIPKGIIGDLSNVHIYEPHLDAVKEQLSRDVDKYGKYELEFLNNTFDLYKLNHDNDIDWLFDNSLIEDFELNNYESYPKIPAEMLAYNK